MSVAEVWANETARIAWNYVALVEATANSTRLDLFRYEDIPAVQGLPKLESRAEWSKAADEGLQAHKTTEEVDSTLKGLIEFATSSLPEEQIKRTPLYFYGTGSFRNLDSHRRHDILQDACQYIRENSQFLVNDCAHHVLYLESDEEAALSLVGVSGGEPNIGILDIAPSETQVVYYAPDAKGKSGMLKLGMRDFNGTTLFHDISVTSQPNFGSLTSPPAACLPTGLDGGAWDYSECLKEVTKLLQPITIDNEVPEKFIAVNGFDTYYNEFSADLDKLKHFCEQPWIESNTASLRSACFLGVAASEILARLPELTAVEFQDSFWPPANLPYSWTGGRALMYAMVDLSSARSRWSQPVGLHRNLGSKKWLFGVDDSVSRPRLGRGRDWYRLIDSQSHRLWGGIVLLIGLAIMVWLLLGRSRRAMIWQRITRQRPSPAYDEQLSYEEFELENQPDERDDFDV